MLFEERLHRLMKKCRLGIVDVALRSLLVDIVLDFVLYGLIDQKRLAYLNWLGRLLSKL